jgi:hypothetical protein
MSYRNIQSTQLKAVTNRFKLIKDGNDYKAYGKNSSTDKFFKRKIPDNPSISKHQVIDDLNKIIERKYTLEDLKLLIKLNEFGVFEEFQTSSLNLAVDLITDYVNSDNIKISSNEDSVRILQVGASGTGKSELLRASSVEYFRAYLKRITGINETTVFPTEFNLQKDNNDKNSFCIKIKFKSKKELDSNIIDMIISFVSAHNSYIHNSELELNDEIFDIEETFNKEWIKSIEKSTISFLVDEEKIFNLKLILGDIENNKKSSELIKLLSELLIKIESLRNIGIIPNDIKENEFKLKMDNFKYILSQKASEKKDLDTINSEYSQLIRNNPTVLEDIQEFVFKESKATIINTFENLNKLNKVMENNKLVDGIDSVLESLYSEDNSELCKIKEYIKIPLMINEKSKDTQTINKKIKETVNEFLDSIYMRTKDATKGTFCISPLIEKASIIMPTNENIILNRNFIILDTVGLTHGDQNAKSETDRTKDRFNRMYNNFNPDVILFHVKFGENTSMLSSLISNMYSRKLFSKTIFIGTHMDETILKSLTNYFPKLDNEEIKEIIDEIETRDNNLAKKLRSLLDDYTIDLENFSPHEDVALKKITEKFFDEVYDITIESSVKHEIFSSINKDKVNFNVNDLGKMAELNENFISNENFNFIIIDKVNGVPTTKNNFIQRDISLKKLFKASEIIHSTIKDKIFLDKDNEKFEISVCNDFRAKSDMATQAYLQGQVEFYSLDNTVLRWNTIEAGIYRLKDGKDGFTGVSFDILPISDFIDTLDSYLLETPEGNEISFRYSPNFDKFKKANIETTFFDIFYKNLKVIAKLYIVKNNVDIYNDMYSPDKPVGTITNYRKRRMKELMKELSKEDNFYNIVKIAIEKSEKDLREKHIQFITTKKK